MKLPFIIRRIIFFVLYFFVARQREPDQFIGGQGGAYMLRWWLFGTSSKLDEDGDKKPRRPFGRSFYLHLFLRSDEDRALHDHPWDFTTLLLFGCYYEHRDEPVEIYGGDGGFDAWDWRGANHICLPNAGATDADKIRVARYYLEGSFVRSKAADLHRVALVPHSNAMGPAMRPFGLQPWDVTNLPWMSDAMSVYAALKWKEEEPVFTLFYGGAKTRRWGFQCKDGWKHWRDFDRDGGCGEKS